MPTDPSALKENNIHDCETPLDGSIQHRWTCKTCGTIWEVVGANDQGNPEWETIGTEEQD